jgi:multidrug efflux pump
MQSNAMALTRGLALIPLLFLGNLLFRLSGVIWSLPAAEIGACLVGISLWLGSRAKIMSVSLEARKALVPEGA